MLDHDKCPQDTDLYCPHYSDKCDVAKKNRIRCVHIEATLAITAMSAMVRNTFQEHVVTAGIKKRLKSRIS